MITRLYPNAKGELQAIAMSVEDWNAITQDAVDQMLGFGCKAPEPEAKPSKPVKGKKK